MKDSTQIVVGQTGSIFVAPVSTAPPASLVTAFAAPWIELGYTSEDGVAPSYTREWEDILVWQSRFPVRRVLAAEDFQLAFTMRQWSRDTFGLAFGGGTVAKISVDPEPVEYEYRPPTSTDEDERALCAEWVDEGSTFRLFIPRGMPVESVESQLQRTAAADLPITFGILGSDNVTPWYLRTNDAAFAPAA